MSIEWIKSVLLVFLILLSLLLTIGIWNYQPMTDELNNENPIEAKLNGKEETKKSIIQPKQIIFHNNEGHHGFKIKSEEKALYDRMQNWSIYDFQTVSSQSSEITPNHNNLVEVIFPTLIPMEILQDIFTIDPNAVIPSTSFDRMFVLLDSDQTSKQIQFVNTENRMKVLANVQNIVEIRNYLKIIGSTNEFIPYIEYLTADEKPIYLPSEIEMEELPFQASTTSTNLLRNVLFNMPSAVRNSVIGAETFTDGTRTMVVYDHYIEYTNPTTMEDEVDNGRQLITNTLNWVNAHKGWTTEGKNAYQLYDLNVENNNVQYRLTYDGFPIFENNNYSTIDITMFSELAYQYNRPLIKLKNAFQGSKVDLKSGEQVLTFLEHNSSINQSMIDDIAVGYKLEEKQGYIFNLTPAWFIKSYLGWREIDFSNPLNKGGSADAMGSN